MFGPDCDPNIDQTANIKVACFGIDGMKKRVYRLILASCAFNIRPRGLCRRSSSASYPTTYRTYYNQQTPSAFAELSLPIGKLEARAITLKEGRFDVGSTLVPHATLATDTARCMFLKMYIAVIHWHFFSIFENVRKRCVHTRTQGLSVLLLLCTCNNGARKPVVPAASASRAYLPRGAACRSPSTNGASNLRQQPHTR